MATRRLEVVFVGDDKSLNKAFKRVNADSRKTSRELDKLSGSMDRLGGQVAKLAKIGALGAAFGAATAGASNLVAGVVAVTAALAPMTGALATVPVLASAAGQAFGVLQLATGGVLDAVGGLNDKLDTTSEAFKDLTPRAQDAARKLEALKQPLRGLQASAQKRLWPGLIAGVEDASKNMPVFRHIIIQTASALGGLSEQVGRLVGSKSFGTDLALIADRNVVLIRTLATAALNLGQALVDVMVAAGPLTQWLASTAGGWALLIKNEAQAGRETGKLHGFFAQTREVLETVVGTLGSLAKAFYNVGRLGAPLGRDILHSLEGSAAAFARWTESARGKNVIAEWFENAREPLWAMGRLVRDLTVGFLQMGNDVNLAPLIEQFRTGLLPLLLDAMNTVTNALAPAMLELATQVTRAFSALAADSGPLVVFIEALALMAEGFANLMESSPLLRQLTVYVLTFAAAWKALRITALIGGIASLVGVVKAAAVAHRALAAGATLSTVAQQHGMVATIAAKGVQLATAAATKVWAAAQWVLNAALAANPIVLVIAAVAALVGAFVLAYKNVDWFRNAVDAAWSWIKNAAVDVFGAIKSVVTTTWNAVSGVTSAVWGGISKFLETTWSILRVPLRLYFTFYRELITGVWNVVKLVTEKVWNAIKPFVTGVWRAIKTAVTTYFNAYKAVITAVWGAIRTVTHTVWNGLSGWLSARWDTIKAVASTGWNAIKSVITGPVRSAIDWIKDAIGHGGKDSKGLVGWLANAWDTITKGAGDFAGAVGKAVTNAFKGVVGKVLGFAIKILEVVGKIPGVGFEGTIKGLKGVGKSLGIPGYARGGVMEAGGPGGKITRPLAVVGEEAPRHEEFIVPTNPAYRSRALGLFGALGSKLGVPGFAQGGVFGYDALKGLAKSVGAPNPGLMAAVGLAESAGKSDAFGPPSGKGLWQIEWNVWANHMRKLGLTDPYNPMQNARMMMEVLRQQGIRAWVAYTNGSYRKFLDGKNGGGGGGLGGLIGKIGGALGQLFSKGASWITDKLPGVGSLPGWMGGFGKEVLGGVTGWIKRKVESLIGGGDGGKLGKGSPAWAGIDAMAKQFGLVVTSFLRPGDTDSLHSLGRAKDYSNSTGPTAQMMGFAKAVAAQFGSKLNELIYTPLGWSIDHGRKVPPYAQAGHYNHVHVGLARGGRVRVGELGPEDVYLPHGSYVQNASGTQRDGGRGDAPLIGEVNITHAVDEHEVARQLAWLVA